MGSVRVYITPFDRYGNYTTEREVTNDLKSVGKIDIDTDSSDFQIGVFRQSNVELVFNNRDGRYSDPESSESIFRFKRADSKVRITWMIAEEESRCGTAIAGLSRLSPETTIFQGLLNDDGSVENAKTEDVKFTTMGYDVLFTRVIASGVSNGDLISAAILACLDQEGINDLLTIDALNIDVSLDQTIDDASELSGKTVKEALDWFLLASNSVLYIADLTVYVKPRDATPTVQQTFYGQASNNGAENIIDLKNVNNGKQRLFNYIVWSNDGDGAQDPDSVALRGVRKKEIDIPIFTNNTKQINIATELVAEFKDLKQELELVTPMDYETVERELLDRVEVDFPTVFVPTEGFELPICGIAICGEAVLPRGLWSVFIPSGRNYKIIRKSMDLKKEEVTLKLRQV